MWFTIRIRPATGTIPWSFPDERWRRLKLQLIHRFIYVLFKPLIMDSSNGVVVNGEKFTLRILIFVFQQWEKRTLQSLKRRDGGMTCTHCMLQSRIHRSDTSFQTHDVYRSLEDCGEHLPNATRTAKRLDFHSKHTRTVVEKVTHEASAFRDCLSPT